MAASGVQAPLDRQAGKGTRHRRRDVREDRRAETRAGGRALHGQRAIVGQRRALQSSGDVS